MKRTRKILTVVGARPQFIKAAPVSAALKLAGLKEEIIHTGQHFDESMSNVFFEELSIPEPAANLGINCLSHGAMTGRMLEKLEAIMVKERPALVLVYGDTNSTLAGALAASKLNIPVAHVEAGLRSFNRNMPEEINRVVVDHLSALLFCPTKSAVGNLAAEGVSAGVHPVGDVMYDATLAATDRARQRSRVLETISLLPKTYSVATVHRAENTDDRARLAMIMMWLERAALERPVVLPLHPRTRKLLNATDIAPRGVVMVDPLSYLDMTQLVHHAAAVFTDSGGLQKEAYFHRVPCVTLREETEWVETIDAGWNRLWTTDAYRPRKEIDDYGSGEAAPQIAALLARAVFPVAASSSD